MRAVDIIRRKRDGQVLPREAIEAFVAGAADGSWPDYQLTALLMAIVLRGMTADETAWLTDAMVRSGERLDLSAIPGTKVGKHSTGGVGDKVSIVLVPLVAACGVVVSKMSGRGLGHTGGTLDKLEAIPGFRVELSRAEFDACLREVGCCLISQSAAIAPADKTLYALRDVSGTVESIPLIAASVMSKKLAEGSDALLLDVKCGRGAFMRSRDDALALARALVTIGTQRGVPTEAVITAMDAPLGCAVGNALEIAECLDLLRGRGPADLTALITTLASRMVRLAGRAADDQAATRMVEDAVASGAALARFEAMVARQGGEAACVRDPGRLPRARHRHPLTAPRAGYIAAVDAEGIGQASMRLGAGRERVGDAIDHAAGVVLHRKPGDTVVRHEPLLELHYNDAARLDEALRLAEQAIVIADEPPALPPIVLGSVRAGSTVLSW